MYSKVKRKAPQSVRIMEKRRQQVLLKEHLKAVTPSEEQLENTGTILLYSTSLSALFQLEYL